MVTVLGMTLDEYGVLRRCAHDHLVLVSKRDVVAAGALRERGLVQYARWPAQLPSGRFCDLVIATDAGVAALRGVEAPASGVAP